MNTERSAYTGWMTVRDRQLFHVLLDGLPPASRTEVVAALARGELLRQPTVPAEAESGDEQGEPQRRAS